MLLAYGYGYGYGYGLHYDKTYILLIIGAIITMAASAYVKSTYNKYMNVISNSGITAAEAAEKILRANGIYDVRIQHIKGDLTDNYNSATRVLSLSDTTYNSRSVAAIGVAAHECGHAIQHAKKYMPLELRKTVYPIANIGSKLSWILIILGIFIGGGNQTILNTGILAFAAVVLFQLITLPVEFDASKRAISILGEYRIVNKNELSVVKKVLTAAALTYVAAAASALLQLIRLVILYGGNNRRKN